MLVERSLDHNRIEIISHNELGHDRVAADVPLARRVERFRIDLADHICRYRSLSISPSTSPPHTSQRYPSSHLAMARGMTNDEARMTKE